jgi:hypothetical protein
MAKEKEKETKKESKPKTKKPEEPIDTIPCGLTSINDINVRLTKLERKVYGKG